MKVSKEAIVLRDKFKLPGMRCLCSSDSMTTAQTHNNIENHIKNAVVYTGTHDNNTVVGWYKNEISKTKKKRISRSLKTTITSRTIHRPDDRGRYVVAL